MDGSGPYNSGGECDQSETVRSTRVARDCATRVAQCGAGVGQASWSVGSDETNSYGH